MFGVHPNYEKAEARRIYPGKRTRHKRSADYEKVRELRRSGKTLNAICMELKCSGQTVRQALREKI